MPCDLIVLSNKMGWDIKMPSTFLITGDKDPIRSCTTLFHDQIVERNKLIDANDQKSYSKIDVELGVYEGETHGFFNFYWKENARKLYKDIENFIESRTTNNKSAVSSLELLDQQQGAQSVEQSNK